MLLLLVVLLLSGKCEIGLSDYDFPRIIWMYWEGSMTEDVKEIIGITWTSLSNFVVYFLSDGNLSAFLNTSNFPTKYWTLSGREKSCYIRVCLVEKYGGLFVDSTLMVNSGKEVEFIFSEALKNKSHFVGLGDGKKFLCSVHLFGACLNSGFLKVVKNEFDKTLYQNDLGFYIKSICRIPKYCYTHMVIDNLFKKVAMDNPSFSNLTLLLPLIRSGRVIKTNYDKSSYYDDIKNVPFVKFYSHRRTGKKMRRRLVEKL